MQGRYYTEWNGKKRNQVLEEKIMRKKKKSNRNTSRKSA